MRKGKTSLGILVAAAAICVGGGIQAAPKSYPKKYDVPGNAVCDKNDVKAVDEQIATTVKVANLSNVTGAYVYTINGKSSGPNPIMPGGLATRGASPS